MKVTAKQLADLLGAQIEGDENVVISGPARIEEGIEGTLTFLGNDKYEKYLYTTKASVALVKKTFTPKSTVSATLLRVDDVYQSMATLMNYFHQEDKQELKVAASAVVAPDAVLQEPIAIGAGTVIESGAQIGQNTIIYPNVFIGKNVVIGEDCRIHPGVCIYHDCIIGSHVVLHANTVIGSDGFGYARDASGKFQHIPQLGNVVIEDHVEIGANAAIDRASIGSTVLRKGCKLDNLIHVAHNVEIGEESAIAAQVGIAGSSKVGANCLIGGQAGIIGHITVAPGTLIQAKSGVLRSTKENEKIQGSPAFTYADFFKSHAVFRKLPELYRKISRLESKLSDEQD